MKNIDKDNIKEFRNALLTIQYLCSTEPLCDLCPYQYLCTEASRRPVPQDWNIPQLIEE